MSDSLRPHGLQHSRPPCPSPSSEVYSNPCPLSQWCCPTISSSVVPFSSHQGRVLQPHLSKEKLQRICRHLFKWLAIFNDDLSWNSPSIFAYTLLFLLSHLAPAQGEKNEVNSFVRNLMIHKNFTPLFLHTYLYNNLFIGLKVGKVKKWAISKFLKAHNFFSISSCLIIIMRCFPG